MCILTEATLTTCSKDGQVIAAIKGTKIDKSVQERGSGQVSDRKLVLGDDQLYLDVVDSCNYV